ncbi:MAG: bifunctional (p)ppGpp synthetase/guanosine-3',5'-bis(diphosphate) 3'-pyrophosphohydrolase [Candidatus Yanofskybacteria bacterium]|nr:bifunctional (p)ppGpp synthetase/guanosine-3',5'-bis(diphosphate) 3'-pyrophosphohydrolase [Candidatus Yanofskybacteria bacterium]
MDTLDALLSKYRGDDRTLIERAFHAAARYHEGQLRASGEPYIIHPLNVALFLADLGFDAKTAAAALLHDALEDTAATRKDIEDQFGSDVAFLVDGVTKLSAISSRARSRATTTDLQTQSLKKMFFAMAEDLRVIIIKLADRLHNLSTLQHKDPESRMRIARQTMDLYAPIADRLGMGKLKGDMEDLAFPWAYPAEYAWLKKVVRGKYADRLRYIERTAPIVKKHLVDAGVPVLDIHSRAKRMWSLYQKLKRYDMDPDKVLDLVALRVIVPDVKSCYAALGIIHTHYRPMPGRVKDYIALPKPNGYRSLHTTVFCEKGRIAEIQIRTPDMHSHAENGVAAHWSYAEAGKRAVSAQQKELAWINQLKSFLRDIKTSQGMAELKIDFFKNRIFALTPEGDIKDLPEGATAIDFAYAVHSELGHRTTGAMANGRIIPLDAPLQSGDVIEIIRGNKTRPSKDWLRIVKTSQAAKHIKSWLKKHDPAMTIADGRVLLNKELGKSRLSLDKLNRRQIDTLLKSASSRSLDDLLTHIGMGDFDAPAIARALTGKDASTGPTKNTPPPSAAPHGTLASVLIADEPGLHYKIGKCCAPRVGTPIAGYLTVARGVTIHAHNCANIKGADHRRLLKAEWS